MPLSNLLPSLATGIRSNARSLGAVAVVAVLAGCAQDAPMSPRADLAASAARAPGAAALADIPSGERVFGKVAVEPAYDADTGELIYLLTPEKAPFPSKANAHAVSPLYLVEYPAGSTVGTLNCMGVPGNCPDHDGEVAQVATSVMPGVYGTDPTLVPGHDHIVDGPGAPDFNIAWQVIEVLFTNAEAANTHLTTEAEIEAAVERGDAIEIDLGFAFNCNVVPATVYWHGTPIG